MIIKNEFYSESVKIETPYVHIHYPDILTPLDPVEIDLSGEENVDAILATVEQEGLVFRPNMVVTSDPSAYPLVDAAYAAYEAALDQHSGARLLSTDLVPVEDEEGTPIGRVFRFVYRRDRFQDVIVKKWVFATGQTHLHFSASFLPSQAAMIEGAFDWVADHLRFKASQAELVASAE